MIRSRQQGALFLVHPLIKGTINGNHRGTDQSKISSQKKPPGTACQDGTKEEASPLVQSGATVLLPARDLVAIL